MKLTSLISVCLLAGTCSTGLATTYYVDSDGGLDTNAGTSPGSAWQTLDKVSNWDFEPGDQILLQRGDSFNGKIFLTGQDNGAEGNPVVVGAYGSGDRPVINAVGYRAGVHIRNARHIEVSDLEIHGDGGAMVDGSPNTKRYGVLIDASGTNVLFEHVTIRNLYIHDIFPLEGDGSEGATPIPQDHPDAGKDAAITWYGTGIAMLGKNSFPSSNVLVEGCQIETVGYKAIEMKWVNQVEILNNHSADIGGPALQPSRVNDLVVRGNVVDGSGSYSDPRMHGRGSGIWPWGSERVLIEKNTFMHARGRADSCGVHIDFNCKDVIVQYNLSIDNGGGFIEILGNNYNCTYRYNISINDGHRVKGVPSNGPGTLNNGQAGHVIWVSGYVGSGNPAFGPFNQYIYNNTIYVKSDIKPTLSVQDTNLGLLVANNIFYLEGDIEDITSNSADNYTQVMVDRVLWKNNLYQRSGIVPTFYNDSLADPSFTDTDPKIGDPLFANTGGLTAADYIPSASNRVEDQGIAIPHLPHDPIGLKVGLPVGEDFFGNPVVGLPDMGAIEMGGTQSPLPDAAFKNAPAPDSMGGATMTGVDAPYNTEYFFTETTGNPGGSDSGWQLSPTYEDSDLLPNTTYRYTVTLRDAFDQAGTPSAEFALTTLAVNPFENPVILDEDFSSAPDPANATIPYPEETFFVGDEQEAQEGSVNSTGGGLRTGWGYDRVQILWYADDLWDDSRDYQFSGDWKIDNVLDVHLGIVVGVGEFDPSTGVLLQRIKEEIAGVTAAPVIGQSGNFSMTITAAELQSAGVSSTNRVGIFIDHDGAGAPERNDVYIVDNLFLTLLGGESDTDEDGIPDSAEPGLGLDPDNPDDGGLDLDGDGQSNFSEFLSGSDLSDPSDIFHAMISLPPGTTEIALPGQFVQDGRWYILEVSETLGDWRVLDAVTGGDVGAGNEQVFTLPQPAGKEFYRIRVEWE